MYIWVCFIQTYPIFNIYVFTHVCDSVQRGGVLSQHALQVVSQHALQHVSGGLPAAGGCLLLRGCLLMGGAWFGGCLLPGDTWSRGLPGWGVWPSVMAFCYGLLVWWPSGVAFWFGGLLIEGSLLVESGLLLWSSGVIFCYGLLVWSSGMVFW